VNLSTPLLVKTKHGELTAGPGDVLLIVKGVARGVATKELYVESNSLDQYESALRQALKERALARRRDDGSSSVLTPEEGTAIDESVEKEITDRRESDEAARVRKQKMIDAFAIDPENPQAWMAVTSDEGPPTANPSVTATLIPNEIPIEVLDTEPPPTGSGADATGATAGAPGAFTPSGATPPANLAALSVCTASPTTAWLVGEHVVLGDASQAYWDGTTWLAGAAPGAAGLSSGGQYASRVPKAIPTK
jgi:hypothetical protein